MVNENKRLNGAVITVKSTPLDEAMKDWSEEHNERMAKALLSNCALTNKLKQPE